VLARSQPCPIGPFGKDDDSSEIGIGTKTPFFRMGKDPVGWRLKADIEFEFGLQVASVKCP
jgi:hypothetical protein